MRLIGVAVIVLGAMITAADLLPENWSMRHESRLG